MYRSVFINETQNLLGLRYRLPNPGQIIVNEKRTSQLVRGVILADHRIKANKILGPGQRAEKTMEQRQNGYIIVGVWQDVPRSNILIFSKAYRYYTLIQGNSALLFEHTLYIRIILLKHFVVLSC